jgi:ABC-2 type transport system permease protein
MNYRGIMALASKDFFLFFQNRLFAVITVIGIIAYLVVYFLLPSGVDQTLEIGLYSPVQLSALENAQEEGVSLIQVDTKETLRIAVEEGEYIAGIAFSQDFARAIEADEPPQVTLYFPPDVPTATKSAMKALVEGWDIAQTGKDINVDFSEQVMGRDLVAGPIPARERLRALFAIFLIMTETLGLASLITEEVETRTLQALLVSPMNTFELFIAKGITGIALAFSQAVLFMIIVGGLSASPGVILVALLLGSAMLTGVAFLIASVSKDMLSVMAWGLLALIIMMVPSAAVLFPGATAGWMKIIPSYYLFDSVHLAANFGAGWYDVWPHLVALSVATVIISTAGIWALNRRYQ